MARLAKAVILSSLLLTACAQQIGYTPTLDVRNDPNPAAIKRDLQECQQLADHATDRANTELMVNTGITTAVGAALGAIGAISKNSATGALIGGAITGIYSIINQSLSLNFHYQRVYEDCLVNRGHRVLE